MSIVEIVHHDEVIYTILDKPPPEPPKTPRYHSQLENELREALSKRPQLRRTFGYAETPVKPPGQFLKKGQGIPLPIKKTDHKCIQSGTLPPVPKRPPPGKKPEKPIINFRVVNIKKAIKTKAKPVQPRYQCCQCFGNYRVLRLSDQKITQSTAYGCNPCGRSRFYGFSQILRLVDTSDGHVKRIKGSGEVPEYCLRPDFGKMPAYLVKRNRKIQKALDAIRYEEENRESLCKLISEEERIKLLNDLKHNWQLMQKSFLQLPMLTDTIPKILRKTKLEQELKDLEKDIALVESNPYIYIYD